jgi:hypothetical protein
VLAEVVVGALPDRSTVRRDAAQDAVAACCRVLLYKACTTASREASSRMGAMADGC